MLKNVLLTLFIVFLSCAFLTDQSHAEKVTKGKVIRVVQEYVKNNTSRVTKTFDIFDPVKKVSRKLEFRKFNGNIGKVKDNYYSSAIFRDMGNSEWVLLDFDVGKMEDGAIRVESVHIHKVGGKRRYIYDRKGNRVPVRQ